MTPLRFVHFADAHIDMENAGKRDPLTGLSFRVLDFLKSLDTIVDTAINEKVDFVLFAGDAYRDRSPLPTHQREWGKRIIRLSRAEIPTLLLVGNHDISPMVGRASSIHEFDTLNVPFVMVISKPLFLKPADLWGLPLQVLAIPWISDAAVRTGLKNVDSKNPQSVQDSITESLTELINNWMDSADPSLPTILLAHASVEGAMFGAERMVMLGGDFTLSPGLVKDARLDYTALGHIHKMQNLNPNGHPPVIYPGSIERVNYGESADEKWFVLGTIEKGKTSFEMKQLIGVRPIFQCGVTVTNGQEIQKQIIRILPSKEKIKDAMISLSITYPRELETQIDINAIREYAAEAFDFRIHLKAIEKMRSRIPEDKTVSSLTPSDLLQIYCKEKSINEDKVKSLKLLAKDIFEQNDEESEQK